MLWRGGLIYTGKRRYALAPKRSGVYAADVGIYEDTAKTEQSERYVSLPSETMELLKQYQVWQMEERLRLGEYYHDQG